MCNFEQVGKWYGFMDTNLDDLKKRKPNRIGEVHVDNLILRLAEKMKFLQLVYYNPPHSSWKTINADIMVENIGKYVPKEMLEV